MSDNSINDELNRAEMMRNDYFNSTGTNYQHLLQPQYFTQQMYYPYVNPYSHLTEANGNMVIHGYGSDGRPKFRRSRTIFNPEQLDILEQHFEKYKYPDVKRRKMIAEEIGLPEERIQIWFQNRRAKDKRQMEEQVKLQKLVDEAIGGTSQSKKPHNNNEGTDISFQNPVEHLYPLQQEVKVKENQFKCDVSHNNGKHSHVEFNDDKDIGLPRQSTEQTQNEKTIEDKSQWQNGNVESQVAIQNIDQDLLFKVANILSASNNATQLITEWSESPDKLQTDSLEEQLRHFAEHHKNVLSEKTESSSSQSQPNKSQ